MKLFLLAIALIAADTFAATNVFETLSVGNATYTNVRISSVTASEAIVLFDGGGKRFKLSELPEHIQKQYGYNSNAAAAEIETNRVKKAIAEKARADQLAQVAAINTYQSDPVELRITDAYQLYGYYKCETTEGPILIKGLPDSIAQHFAKIKSTEAYIQDEELRVERLVREAEDADNTAPTGASGSPEYVRAAMAKRERANQMITDAKRAKADLEKSKANLQSLSSATRTVGSIAAAKTAISYGGLKIWAYTGKTVPIKNRGDKSGNIH